MLVVDYCVYTNNDTGGWCTGGADEPAVNEDGTRPTSIAQCWAACTTSYGSDLKAIDFWPTLANTKERRGSCFCQEACSELKTDGCSAEGIGPCHLAILPSAIPGTSGLTTCPEASALPRPDEEAGGRSPTQMIIRIALPVAGVCSLIYLIYYLKKQKKLCFKTKEEKVPPTSAA